MRIPKPKGLTTFQIMLATILGVGSGTYIWQKPLKEYAQKQKTSEN